MRQGFTLIQISILLILASIVLVAILPSTRTNLNANNVTTIKLNAVLIALREYEAKNAALPCPADASQPISGTNYGVAAANPGLSTNCGGGTPAANYTDSTNNVAIGMVPVRALGLSNDYALDGYGRDITYAVDTNATSCFSGTLPGRITVTDNGTANSTIAALVSHGADGHGAWITLTGSGGAAVRLNSGSTDIDQHVVNAHGMSGAGFPANYATINSLVTDAENTTTTFVKKMPTATFDDLIVYKSNLWNINTVPAASASLLPSVVPPTSGSYSTGQTLTFTVIFAGTIAVTGTPELMLSIPQSNGTTATHYATYTSTSGNTATFTYTVQSTDYAPSSPSSVAISSPIVLNGGSITVGGGAACLTFTPPSLTGVLLNPVTIYVVDTGNYRVQKFSANGTWLGSIGGTSNACTACMCTTGTCPHTQGTGNGQFYGPSGVAADSSGNIWVSDAEVSVGRLEKFDQNGNYLLSYSGSNYPTCPRDIAFDKSGDVWFTDTCRSWVQEISSSGGYINLFGTYTSNPNSTTPGTFYAMGGISFDSSGNYYITDQQHIDKYTPFSTYDFQFDPSVNPPGAFVKAENVIVTSANNLWVADVQAATYVMQKFSNTGTYLTGFGTSGTGAGQIHTEAAGIAIDPSGNLWVNDFYNNRVEEFDSCGNYLFTFGTGGTGNGQFNGPAGIAIYPNTPGPDGACITTVAPPSNGSYTTGQTLTFTVTYNGAVTVTGTPELVLTIGSNTRYATYASGSGTTTLTFSYTIQSSDTAVGAAVAGSINLNGGTITSGGVTAGLNFTAPSLGGITINSSAFMLVGDYNNNRVEKLDLAGNYLMQFGCSSGACSTGSGNGQFNGPVGAVGDGNGNIWAADENNNRFEKFSSTGLFAASLGGTASACTNCLCTSGTCPTSFGSGNGQFSSDGPTGIAVDGSGNIWTSDYYGHRVEEFDSSGNYKLQIGSTGTSACGASQFENPVGIKFDSSGNVYVVDNSCGQVEEFTGSGGYVKTIGPTITGYGTLSPNGYTNDVTFDACGNMWIADAGNNYLAQTDYEGNYVQKVSYGNGVTGLAVDASGRIYAVGDSTSTIAIYNNSGTLLNTLGSTGSSNGQFNGPLGIALVGSSPTRLALSSCPAVILAAAGPTAGNYASGSTLGFAVTYDQAVTVTGTPEIAITIGSNTRYATYQSGSGTTTLTFQYTVQSSDSAPSGITMNAPISLNSGTISSNSIASHLYFQPASLTDVTVGTQSIYVSDYTNNNVQVFNGSGTYVSKFGSTGTSNGQFENPAGIAVDSSGNVWVVDIFNNRVQKFNSSGTYVSQIGCGTGACTSSSSNGKLSSPFGVAIDSSGNIWVLDTYNNRVQKFNSSGTYQSKFGSSGTATGKFDDPYGIAIDASNNIWVADTYNNRVQKFNSSGTYQLAIGAGYQGVGGTATHTGTANGQFNGPNGLAVDSSGNVWVSDGSGNRVQKFSSSGTYISQIGCSSGACTAGTGNGQFNDPDGVYIDSSGNIWVTDYTNTRVQEFNSSGTYVVQFGSSGTGNGQFSGPWGISIGYR